jgi:elongation factor G
MTDPYVGQLTFIRVYSGTLKKGDAVFNPVKGKTRVMTASGSHSVSPVVTSFRPTQAAISPACSSSTADQEKMGIALQRLASEDPSFRLHTDEESGQTIISGMGAK